MITLTSQINDSFSPSDIFENSPWQFDCHLSSFESFSGGHMGKKLFFGIDVIKVIAIVSVVSVHFLLNTDFYGVPIIGTSLNVQVFYRQLFIVCVPLFLLATGYLQLEKEWNKKYLKSTMSVVYIYLILSLFAILARILLFKEIHPISFWIKSVFTFEAVRYAWYVEMYIGLALLIPFLNYIWKSFKTKRDFQIFIVILLFITAMPGFWNAFSEDVPYISVIRFPGFWTSLYPVTYYFIGVYIRRYGSRIPPLASLFGFLGATLVQTLVICLKTGNGTFVNGVGSYDSLLIVIQSYCLFSALYRLELPKSRVFRNLAVPVSSISVLTLDIYLASAITDKFIYEYIADRLFTAQKYAILFAPLCVTLSFSLAYAVALLRKTVCPLRGKRPRPINEKPE